VVLSSAVAQSTGDGGFATMAYALSAALAASPLHCSCLSKRGWCCSVGSVRPSEFALASAEQTALYDTTNA